MPAMPEENRVDIEDRLLRHVAAAWPSLDGVKVRFRGPFAYADAVLPGGEIQPLCRLRWNGDDHRYGFGLWQASRNGYDDTLTPDGDPVTTPEHAFDFAATFYLNSDDSDEPPTN